MIGLRGPALEQVKGIIDELARAGMFRLNLVGGEPLRPDIGDIVRAESAGSLCHHDEWVSRSEEIGRSEAGQHVLLQHGRCAGGQ